MTVSIIAAVSKNNVIGKDNKLPWHLPTDLARFKELTSGHTVIMGRKTYESIGRPLHHRRNIVITRNKDFSDNGIETVHSIEQALNLAKDDGEVFVIGGEQIYRLALPIADKIYLTVVELSTEGDAYFPVLDPEWKEVSRETRGAEDRNQYNFEFVQYRKT